MGAGGNPRGWSAGGRLKEQREPVWTGPGGREKAKALRNQKALRRRWAGRAFPMDQCDERGS